MKKLLIKLVKNSKILYEGKSVLITGRRMLPTKLLKKRQFLFTEGEPAREMYIIKEGTVKVVKNFKKNPIEIATIGKGGFLGEVALLRNEKHGATAIADSDLELVVINKETFDQQLECLPNWIHSLIRSLADRLHNTDSKLAGAYGGSGSPDIIKEVTESQNDKKLEKAEEEEDG